MNYENWFIEKSKIIDFKSIRIRDTQKMGYVAVRDQNNIQINKVLEPKWIMANSWE